jgi:tetratricopeptide (TPR) repeat protein
MRGPEEAERAFRRAAELQPSSAPLRAHLLDLAFGWRPDSARIATELEVYGRVAPGSRRAVAGRIAFGLAFGGPDARSLARAALDTLDSETGGLTYSFLRHPRFVAERETVYGAVRSRLRQGDSDLPMLWRFMDVGAGTGRVREALGRLDDPLMPPHVRGCGPLQLSILGLPVPDAILEAVLSTSRADTSAFRNASWVACAAKYAAARGHWGEHQRFLSHARDLAAAALAAGDTAGARRWDRTVLDAEAFALWRQGRKTDALASFQSLLARHVDAEWVLWYVGQLATEVDRFDVAERAYERLWLEPLAYLNLGRIYERTNRPVEARKAYELFALAWRHADPELQPLVQEARRAIARLRRAEDRSMGTS